ncbi:hypothetical protein [Zoogloea sp.]|uniref:hypothetical protein n=1 Tax=Zoogloea sp. TaxID=49181 RepID=UPI0025D949DF|nr:hypothetical protein [Zoogloea sp.]MCK6394566.1 hypothetical protein [Zoogloea sp.]
MAGSFTGFCINLLELEKAPEPGLFALGPEGDFLEGVHVAKHRTDSHRLDLPKILPARIAGTARLVNQGKAAHQRNRCRCSPVLVVKKTRADAFFDNIYNVLTQAVNY